MNDAPRNCTRCGEMKEADAFYFVSKKTGRRRGQCKDCMREVKEEQRDPDWLPSCAKCGNKRPRAGSGRRLCKPCFDALYDEDGRRSNGSHRLHLSDCPLCGARRLHADHVKHTALCPVCRSVPQHRRKRLKEHNLTPPEYLALLEDQGNRCAICKKPKGSKTLHLDHKHSEPRLVRGCLCNNCNTLLGVARDSIQVLEQAISYLKLPPAQRLYPGRASDEKANRGGMSWNRLTRRATPK